MEFLTLESYVQWRNTKRVTYKELSDKISLLKKEIRAVMKAGGYAGNMQSSLIYLKYDATDIMEERKRAKIIARESWDIWKSKEAKVAA